MSKIEFKHCNQNLGQKFVPKLGPKLNSNIAIKIGVQKLIKNGVQNWVQNWGPKIDQKWGPKTGFQKEVQKLIKKQQKLTKNHQNLTQKGVQKRQKRAIVRVDPKRGCFSGYFPLLSHRGGGPKRGGKRANRPKRGQKGVILGHFGSFWVIFELFWSLLHPKSLGIFNKPLKKGPKWPKTAKMTQNGQNDQKRPKTTKK